MTTEQISTWISQRLEALGSEYDDKQHVSEIEAALFRAHNLGQQKALLELQQRINEGGLTLGELAREVYDARNAA